MTASLAHLDLSEDEVAAALPAFEQMLEYFAAMKAADEDDETASLFAVQSSDASSSDASFAGNCLRLDSAANNQNSNPLLNLANALVNRVPLSENRFVVIPNVL